MNFNFNVIKAIFRRNFVSYFSNPTGYVFICVYVLLNSFAAFWPNEFFNANLANLEQLNRYLPYIMLVFIPAITMSIWAEERRQGTDELLLTIPAADFDVVLGKYLAAVAIFTVALVFSLVCNLAVLWRLGGPDLGLFIGTFFGYWMVGLAMLAIGMVASFLTGNLTVGFVLGAAFNAPLAFASNADVILPADWATEVKSWSVAAKFYDFGRGVISLSGVAFFLAIVAVMLYLSIVLISRRHWQGGRDGTLMGGHYLARALALAAIAAGVSYACKYHDLRADVTSERLSSLSPDSRRLIRELDAKHPVRIDAYFSPDDDVPEAYVQTQHNLLSTLREFDVLGGDTVAVHFHPTRALSEEADQAEKQFGITPQNVVARNRGAVSQKPLFLGLAFTSGLEKVVIPFVDRGLSVEYEIVRSICTVSRKEHQKRKKIGVLATDAKLYGDFNMQTMSQTPKQLLIEELEKQYEVVRVNADAPIMDDIDALLAVQPSTLGPQQMPHFIEAVRRGVPTAIFEDPLPTMFEVPGTSQPRRAPQQNPMMGMMGGQQPPPKGRIEDLWRLLHVQFPANDVVWQDYNPFPKFAELPKEYVFVDKGASDRPVFDSEDQISAKLQQLLFAFAGSVTKKDDKLKFEQLVLTGSRGGTLKVDEIFTPGFGRGMELNRTRRFKPPAAPTRYTLAARIRGKAAGNKAMSDQAAEPVGDDERADNDDAEGDLDRDARGGDDPTDAEGKAGEGDESDARPDGATGEDVPAENLDMSDDEPQEAQEDEPASDDSDEKPKPEPKKPREIDVVLVADVDLLSSQFFQLRSQGQDPDSDITINLDNVTFVLNTLDSLAGDSRFISIRNRRLRHRTLTTIENRTKDAREEAQKKIDGFRDELNAARETEQAKLDKEVAAIRKLDIDEAEKRQRIALAEQVGNQRLQQTMDRAQKKINKQIAEIERGLATDVSRVQDWYKMWAVFLPPVLPLLMGMFVFFGRRAREREGVARSRLR
ncbi:MAG TPA: Gldg family protein [Pirellulales bacterium]|nr:Gldg family protein [Pirellulales bacterium]